MEMYKNKSFYFWLTFASSRITLHYILNIMLKSQHTVFEETRSVHELTDRTCGQRLTKIVQQNTALPLTLNFSAGTFQIIIHFTSGLLCALHVFSIADNDSSWLNRDSTSPFALTCHPWWPCNIPESCPNHLNMLVFGGQGVCVFV